MLRAVQCGLRSAAVSRQFSRHVQESKAGSLGFDTRLLKYLVDNSVTEHPEAAALRELTASHRQAVMQISPDEGQLLQMVLKLLNARKTVEIGVFTGYSALVSALALPDDGKLVACDVNEEFVAMGQPFWERAGVAHKIDLRIGPALDTLQELLDAGEEGTYDFVFVDADKSKYDTYYEESLKLLRPGGVVGVDNVLWHGRVLEPKDKSTRVIMALNEKIHQDDRLDARCMLPLGDGIYLAQKKLL